MKKILLSLTISLFSLFILVSSASAATFSFDPGSKNVSNGDQFTVNVILDTQTKLTNGVQAIVTYPKEFLQAQDVSFSSLFPSNFKNIDSGAGKISLGGGEDSVTEGYQGRGAWATITFKALKDGSAQINFACLESSILQVVDASNLLDCQALSAGTYIIGTSTNNPPSNNDPGTNNDTNNPASCSESVNTPTGLKVVSGSVSGEVILTWNAVSGATNYNLAFGSQSQKYEYGAVGIGNTNRYVVKSLTVGKLYYFAVSAVRNCASSGLSNEVSLRAGGGGAAQVAQKITIAPTPSIYQPIDKVYAGSSFPSPTESPLPLPESVASEGKQLWLSFLEESRMLILVIILLLFLIIGFIIWKIKNRQPPISTIGMITSNTPPFKETSNQNQNPQSPNPPVMPLT